MTLYLPAFDEEQIGVGNVCERSAGAASSGGEKLVGKTADNGVTLFTEWHRKIRSRLCLR